MEFKNTPHFPECITTGTSGTLEGTFTLDQNFYWSNPVRVEIVERLESIEIIYKQTSLGSLGIYPPAPPTERVFKIVYSCKDGKWHKSKPIYGTIVPQTKETYIFDEN